MSRLRRMTLYRCTSQVFVFGLAIGAGACGPTTPGRTVTAPTPLPPAGFVVSVRSGLDGFPPVSGATVEAGSARVVTNEAGRVTVPLASLGSNDIYTVSAPGHVGFVSRLGLGTTVTLWPLIEGTTPSWIFDFSYTTNYAVEFLSRPTDDVRIQIPPALDRALSTWTAASRLISAATTSGDPTAPTVRIVGAEPGAWLMTDAAGPCPRPPCLPVVAARVEATDYALEVLAGLTGFDLAGSRRRQPPPNPFALSNVERLALRMRFLRVPGTIWDAGSRESDWQIVDADGVVRYR